MRPLHLLAFTLLSGLLSVHAQEPPAQPAIERQMTPEQFHAAGLDKLSAQELANLNAWLNKTLDAETTRAATRAKEKVEDENRGFFDFGSDEPIASRISGEFRGFGKNRLYTLDNGQQWRQTDAASLAGVRLDNPGVEITPSLVGNAWYMRVEGYNTRAKVERVK